MGNRKRDRERSSDIKTTTEFQSWEKILRWFNVPSIEKTFPKSGKKHRDLQTPLLLLSLPPTYAAVFGLRHVQHSPLCTMSWGE